MRKLTIGLQSPEGHSQIRARQPPNSLLQALLCLLPASLLLHSSSSYLALWAFKCETRVLHPAEVKPTHTSRTSNPGRHRQWSTGFFPAESSPHCGACLSPCCYHPHPQHDLRSFLFQRQLLPHFYEPPVFLSKEWTHQNGIKSRASQALNHLHWSR